MCTATHKSGVLVKQHDLMLMQETECIKCWFNVAKINVNTEYGMYNIKIMVYVLLYYSAFTDTRVSLSSSSSSLPLTCEKCGILLHRVSQNYVNTNGLFFSCG
jgi:hypothetical protein